MKKTKPKKTLHLVLKTVWFEFILMTFKKEEYRDLTPYWAKRFTKFTSFEYIPGLENSLPKYEIWAMEYDTITFSLGYKKNRPQVEVDFKGFEIKGGRKEWGAEPGKKYFVLKLGEIINTKNLTNELQRIYDRGNVFADV